jgi:hypothetical protein
VLDHVLVAAGVRGGVASIGRGATGRSTLIINEEHGIREHQVLDTRGGALSNLGSIAASMISEEDC